MFMPVILTVSTVFAPSMVISGAKNVLWPVYNSNYGDLVRRRNIPIERPPQLAKLVPTLADRGCRVVSATNPHRR
jgi:hypothetical protein